MKLVRNLLFGMLYILIFYIYSNTLIVLCICVFCLFFIVYKLTLVLHALGTILFFVYFIFLIFKDEIYFLLFIELCPMFLSWSKWLRFMRYLNIFLFSIYVYIFYFQIFYFLNDLTLSFIYFLEIICEIIYSNNYFIVLLELMIFFSALSFIICIYFIYIGSDSEKFKKEIIASKTWVRYNLRVFKFLSCFEDDNNSIPLVVISHVTMDNSLSRVCSVIFPIFNKMNSLYSSVEIDGREYIMIDVYVSNEATGVRDYEFVTTVYLLEKCRTKKELDKYIWGCLEEYHLSEKINICFCIRSGKFLDSSPCFELKKSIPYDVSLMELFKCYRRFNLEVHSDLILFFILVSGAKVGWYSSFMCKKKFPVSMWIAFFKVCLYPLCQKFHFNKETLNPLEVYIFQKVLIKGEK